jgi:hypothetical protein
LAIQLVTIEVSAQADIDTAFQVLRSACRLWGHGEIKERTSRIIARKIGGRPPARARSPQGFRSIISLLREGERRGLPQPYGASPPSAANLSPIGFHTLPAAYRSFATIAAYTAEATEVEPRRHLQPVPALPRPPPKQREKRKRPAKSHSPFVEHPAAMASWAQDQSIIRPEPASTTNEFSGPQPKRADDVRTIPIDFPVKLFVGSAGLSAYQMRNSLN